MTAESLDDQFRSAQRPLLAALATNAARPGALTGIVGAVGVLTTLGFAVADARARGAIGMGLAGLAAMVLVLAAPTAAAQQAFVDRQSGAMDQHRIAGRSPAEVLVAYVLGPAWSVYAVNGAVALGATALCLGGGHGRGADALVPLAVAAGSAVVALASSVVGVALAMGIDRNLPITQAGGVGVIVPVLRLVVWAVVFAATRDQGFPALLALEALVLGVSARAALRRIAREEDDVDVSLARDVALALAAVTATALGAAHVSVAPRGAAFPAASAVVLVSLVASAFTPSRGALFRAWVADGALADRDLRRLALRSALAAGVAVIAARVLGGGPVDGALLTVALFAAALTAALRGASSLGLAGMDRGRLGWLFGALTALPALVWAASRAVPLAESSGAASSAVALFGAAFNDSRGPADLAARAGLCVLVWFGAARAASRALKTARAAALARVPGR
jgi:hypothetical protein